MCNKVFAFKIMVLTIIAIIILFFNVVTRQHNKHVFFSFAHSSNFSDYYLRRTKLENNVYTIIYGADNSTIQDVQFNSPIVEYNTDIVFVESTDFKRAFSSSNSVSTIENNATSNNTFQNCPLVPVNLKGPIIIFTVLEVLKKVEEKISSLVENGGFYKPKECIPRYKVALVIPFRNRHEHLTIFLNNIHTFLMKQQIEYQIYVIEQTDGKPFNRASLMNIGFIEALKLHDWDCFIFHDVDLIPLDDRNLYTCPDQPRHMSVAIDILGFKLPYNSIFGGVSSMTTKQFESVNGFSNSYWGWGGEDDDMSSRLKHANYHISRYPINIARYMMLNHKKEKANPKRFENLANAAKKFSRDGLNSVVYKVISLRKLPLFTWLLVDVKLVESI